MEETSKKKKIIIGISIAVVFVIILILLLLKGCSKDIKEFTVTFDTNGGTIIEDITLKENEKVGRPEEPTKEGYTFAGWYYEDKLFDFNTKIDKDITLIARWVEEGSLALESMNMTLTENESDEIKIVSYPSGITLSDLEFTSSDESIIKVDSNGKITAIKSGTATITIKTKDGKYEKTVTITVNKKEEEKPTTNKDTTTKPSSGSSSSSSGNSGGSSSTKPNTPTKPTEVPVTDITISGNNSVNAGSTLQLSANITPNNATDKSVTWLIVSGGDKATIDQTGKLTAKAGGKVTVQAKTKNGKVATKEITIISNYKIVLMPGCTELPGIPPLVYYFHVYRDGVETNDFRMFIYNTIESTPGSYTIPSSKILGSIKEVSLNLNDGSSVNAKIEYQANNNC